MDYNKWIREFKETLAHELEKELVAEIDDNVMRGYTKKELKWKPLSERYRKKKEKEGRNLRGLIYHGHLLRATQSRIKVDDKGIIIRVMNNMEYSGFIEFGTKKMPARPYIKPALDKTMKNLPKIIEKVVKKL